MLFNRAVEAHFPTFNTVHNVINKKVNIYTDGEANLQAILGNNTTLFCLLLTLTVKFGLFRQNNTNYA